MKVKLLIGDWGKCTGEIVEAKYFKDMDESEIEEVNKGGRSDFHWEDYDLFIEINEEINESKWGYMYKIEYEVME
jgi:hypothetical protein